MGDAIPGMGIEISEKEMRKEISFSMEKIRFIAKELKNMNE